MKRRDALKGLALASSTLAVPTLTYAGELSRSSDSRLRFDGKKNLAVFSMPHSKEHFIYDLLRSATVKSNPITDLACCFQDYPNKFHYEVFTSSGDYHATCNTDDKSLDPNIKYFQFHYREENGHLVKFRHYLDKGPSENVSLKKRIQVIGKSSKQYLFKIYPKDMSFDVLESLNKTTHFVCLLNKSRFDRVLSQLISNVMKLEVTNLYSTTFEVPENFARIEKSDFLDAIQQDQTFHKHLEKIKSKTILEVDSTTSFSTITQQIRQSPAIQKLADSMKSHSNRNSNPAFKGDKSRFFSNFDEIKGWYQDLV